MARRLLLTTLLILIGIVNLRAQGADALRDRSAAAHQDMPPITLADALGNMIHPAEGRKGAKLTRWLLRHAQERMGVTLRRSGSCTSTTGSYRR